MNNDSEAVFLRKAHAIFMASVGALDDNVRTRLREARRSAVAVTIKPHPRFWLTGPWVLPAGAMAILVVAALGTFIWSDRMSQSVVPFATRHHVDADIVLSKDNLDMYADMDFYRWLQTQKQQHNGVKDQSGANRNG